MGDIVLQGAGSFRPDLRHLAKKTWRQRLLSFLSEPSDSRPPQFGNAYALPLVNAVALNCEPRLLSELLGHDRGAAEVVDEFRVGFVHGENVFVFLRNVKADDWDDMLARTRDAHDMATVRKPYHVACGKRLRQARMAINSRYRERGGLRRFAENTGVPESNLNNWELGNVLVPPSYVQRLKEVFGISHDWIFGADASKMDPDLSVKLLAAQMEDDEPAES